MQEYPGLDYDHFLLKEYEKMREESAHEKQIIGEWALIEP